MDAKLSNEEIEKLIHEKNFAYLDKLVRENILSKADDVNFRFRNRLSPTVFGIKKSPLVFEDKNGKLKKCFVTRLDICRNAEPNKPLNELNDWELKEAMIAEITKELQKFDAVISVIEQRRGIGEKYVFNFVDYYCKGV